MAGEYRAGTLSFASPAVFRDLVLTGVRVGGNEAKRLGIVDEAVPIDEVLPKATALAASLAQKDRHTYQTLKRTLYGEVAAVLESDRFDLSEYL